MRRLDFLPPTAVAERRERPRTIPAFTRLLVPLDLAGDSRAALEKALLVAQATRAETTLLHVVSPFEGRPRHSYPRVYHELESEAEAKLATLAKRFRKKHLTVHEEIRVGDPVLEILACAKRAKADLIVLRSHAYDADDPARGWATTSYAVATLCRCPVLLAK